MIDHLKFYSASQSASQSETGALCQSNRSALLVSLKQERSASQSETGALC